MIPSFNWLFDKTKPAFAQERTFERVRTKFSGWYGKADRKRHALRSDSQSRDKGPLHCSGPLLLCFPDLFFLGLLFFCRARLWRFSVFIVIQIMCDAVADSAFRELGQH